MTTRRSCGYYFTLLHITSYYFTLLHITYFILLHITSHYFILLQITSYYFILLHITSYYFILLHIASVRFTEKRFAVDKNRGRTEYLKLLDKEQSGEYWHLREMKQEENGDNYITMSFTVAVLQIP